METLRYGAKESTFLEVRFRKELYDREYQRCVLLLEASAKELSGVAR